MIPAVSQAHLKRQISKPLLPPSLSHMQLCALLTCPPTLLSSGNIRTAASPLNLELLLKAPLLLWDTLEAADFLIKAAAECVSAAVCSLWWADAAKPHARTLGWLKEGVGSQLLWRLWREQSAAGNKISLHANNSCKRSVQKLWGFKEQTEGYFEITTSIKYNIRPICNRTLAFL